MNRDQYFNQHRLQQIQHQELERKWRVYNEQKQMNRGEHSNFTLNATERYYVSDCPGINGPIISMNYPMGSFKLNDRVTFSESFNSFGIIQNILLPSDESSEIRIYSTGVNTTQCIDKNIELISYCQPDPNDIYAVRFAVDIKPLNAPFVSVNS